MSEEKTDNSTKITPDQGLFIFPNMKVEQKETEYIPPDLTPLSIEIERARKGKEAESKQQTFY